MALNFPSNPVENDIYQFGLLTYIFKNGKWVSQSRGASQLPWYSNMEQARALWKRLAAEAGLNLVDGSFEEGAEITSSSDVVWWQAGSAIYGWNLNEAKTVPPGSTPATAGGVGVGAWSDKTDLTLRSELSASGGYLLVSGIPNYIPVSRFVANGVTGQDALDAAFAYSAANGIELLGDIALNITRPILQIAKSKIKWVVDCTIDSASFVGDYVYHIDGGNAVPSYDVSHVWTLVGKTKMSGFRAYVDDFDVGVSAKALTIEHSIGVEASDVVITGALLGGLDILSGYEGCAENMWFIVSSARSDSAIGVNVTTSDIKVKNIFPVGYATGLNNTKTANTFENIHPWGNNEDGGVGNLGKMYFGFINGSLAGLSSFINCYADTVCRINSSLAPSRTNGGVEYINDAWQTSFTNCLGNQGGSSASASCIGIINTGKQNTFDAWQASKPSRLVTPFMQFESSGSTEILNHINGGALEMNIAGDYSYFKPVATFLSAVSSRQQVSYKKASLSYNISGATIVAPTTTSDNLTISCPSFVTSTCTGSVEVPQLMYAFRKAETAIGKTIRTIFAKLSAGSIIFTAYFTDNTSTNITGYHITAGETVYASFTLDVFLT